MARVSTYLNFARCTEEAFLFYRGVFGTEFNGLMHRFGEMPPCEGQPPLAEADRLFNGLSAGGVVGTAMPEMLWGAYFGSFSGRCGARWTVNCRATGCGQWADGRKRRAGLRNCRGALGQALRCFATARQRGDDSRRAAGGCCALAPTGAVSATSPVHPDQR